MDDLNYGKRNKRGDWAPNKRLEIAPLFVFPPQPLQFLKWLPSYFLPWNALFMAISAVYWFWLTPSRDTLKTLSPGWVVYMWLLNMAIVIVVYGALELRLYVRRGQATSFKYNAKWPAENRSDVFMFKSQNLDNMIRTFGTGIPIWTAYQVGILSAYGNGWGPWTTFSDHPMWLATFGLLLPIYHEAHFYCIHRLIHVPVLYKFVHSVHHNSINPSPWSSLSMHPIEHLLYWSDSLIHLILPSHPLLLLYNLQITGTGAVVGHVGFDKIVAGENTAFETGAFAHYLHHKYFEVNYADGTVPFDKLFGTWHDGSKQGQALMEARFDKKRERVNKQT